MSAISVNEDSPDVDECSSTSRIFSPAAVPPGSRVTVTATPRERRERASFSSCVLLPLPSRPSKVMNFPRPGTSKMIAGEQGSKAENRRQAGSRKGNRARSFVALAR